MRKKNLRHTAIAGFTIGAALAGTAVGAFGNVIYSDNFSGAAGSDLNANAPTNDSGVDGGMPGATWTVTAGTTDATWLYSGSNSTTITSPNGVAAGRDTALITAAYLPFVPQAGLIYDLSATIQVPAAGTDSHWVGLSFINNLNTGNGGAEALSNDSPTGLVIVRDGNGTNTTFGSGQTTDQIDIFEGAAGGTSGDTSYNIPGGIGNAVTIDEILNTTGSSDTITWEINGTNVGTTTTLSGNSAINYVAFGDDTAPAGTVSAFSLTDNAVPEPTSLGMLGLGAMALVRRRRR